MMSLRISQRVRRSLATSAALGAAVAAAHAASAAPTVARWLAPISGDWTDSTQWSTDPQYPNNDPQAAITYDVAIDAIGNPYVISLQNYSGITTVASFVLDSPDATLVHRNFVFQSLGTFDLRRGTYQLGATNSPLGGTISNSTITSSGTGRILVPQSCRGTLDHVNLQVPLTIEAKAALRITNGLTLGNNSRIILNGGGLTAQEMQTISGNGEIVLDGADSTITCFTLDPNVTVRTGAAGGAVGVSINKGTISSETPGVTLKLSTFDLANEGVLQAINGGRLTLDVASAAVNTGTVRALDDSTLDLNCRSWTNTGTLEIRNATLNLGGGISASALGNLRRTGGTVNVTGTVNNVGSTLPLDAFGGWNFAVGGGILGGTLGADSNPATLRIVGPSPLGMRYLADININCDVSVQNAGLSLQGNWANNRTISVSDGILSLGGTPKNMGTIQVNNSTVSIVGTYTPAQLATIAATSSRFLVKSNGTLDNTDNVLTLTPTTPVWQLADGRIRGGTITASGDASLHAVGGRGTLENVTLDAPLVMEGAVGVTLKQSDSTWANPRVTFAPDGASSSTLELSGPTVLSGTGQIVFAARGTVKQMTGKSLTIGPDVLIRADRAAGTLTPYSSLVNQGTVSAEDGGSLEIGGGGAVTNEGTLSAQSGASLAIGGTFTNQGTLEARDSRITFRGRVTNLSGNTLTGGTWALYGDASFGLLGTIETNAATVIASGDNAGRGVLTRDLRLNTGSLTLTDGASIAGQAFTNSGSLTLGPRSTLLLKHPFIQTTGTIGGAGQLTLFEDESIIGGTQAWLDGARVTINSGRLVLNSDAGSVAAANLTLVAKQATGQVVMNSSQHLKGLQLTGTASLVPGADKLLYVRDLSLDPNGQLDLHDNDLIVQATQSTRADVLAQVTELIKTARAGQTDRWQGPGITTSTALENHLAGLAVIANASGSTNKPLFTEFDGQPVDANSILVKYTWNGDANLDGKIDLADYFQIDSGFITQKSGYRNGDFNFDGKIDLADYFLIDSAFIGQRGVLSIRTTPPGLPVPEPGVLATLAIGALSLLPRRGHLR